MDQPDATTLKLIKFRDELTAGKSTGIDQQAGVKYITFSFDKGGYQAVLKGLSKARKKLPGSINASRFHASYVRDPNGVFVELLGRLHLKVELPGFP